MLCVGLCFLAWCLRRPQSEVVLNSWPSQAKTESPVGLAKGPAPNGAAMRKFWRRNEKIPHIIPDPETEPDPVRRL